MGRDLPEIPGEQVGLTHCGRGLIPGLGDRVLHEAFLEADPEVAEQDLDQVFGFRGAERREQLLHLR